MLILVTGGAGYIGSHTVVELINRGFDIIIVDNFSRSRPFIIKQIEKIVQQRILYYCIDLCDRLTLEKIFKKHAIEGIIHFAAYKAVSESVQYPLRYYQNNLVSLMNILHCIQTYAIPYFVFSSSCTIYGNPDVIPVTEESVIKSASSPYGATKQMAERMIMDIYAQCLAQQKAVLLRYFNPAGAHSSGLIGELPIDKPQNLLPAITQTAIGKLPQMTVHGLDYNTRDGSCIRDYIDIEDLAQAHTLALQHMMKNHVQNHHRCEVFNLGTGKGISVLEAIQAFEQETGQHLNYAIGPRRPGDVEVIFANKDKAEKLLKWQPRYDIHKMMRTAWEWELRLNNGEEWNNT